MLRVIQKSAKLEGRSYTPAAKYTNAAFSPSPSNYDVQDFYRSLTNHLNLHAKKLGGDNRNNSRIDEKHIFDYNGCTITYWLEDPPRFNEFHIRVIGETEKEVKDVLEDIKERSGIYHTSWI